jgi:hypothetical protein
MITTVERTIDLSTVGSLFVEGPVLVDGAVVASVEAVVDRAAGSAAWTSGVLEVQGGISPTNRRAFSSAVTISTAAVFLRNIGHSTVGVAADAYLFGVVTTAEAGVKLRVTFYLNDNN